MSNKEKARNQLQALNHIISDALEKFETLDEEDYRRISFIYMQAQNLSTY